MDPANILSYITGPMESVAMEEGSIDPHRHRVRTLRMAIDMCKRAEGRDQDQSVLDRL